MEKNYTLSRITTALDPLYEKVREIYMGSFPVFERRTPEHQDVAFARENYHLDVYALEEGILVGFIGYWVFDHYLYVEHLAMNPSLRGAGHGSAVMKAFLKGACKPVILEIDPLEDEVARRRLRFYEHLGFVLNEGYDHLQPIYCLEDTEEHRLLILSYPHRIGADIYDKFYKDLCEVVISRTLKGD